MLSEEQHILIDKFFNGELTAEETQQFKDLLHGDATFRAEVELQQQVINGIGVFGAAQLKTELQDIHKEVQADLQSYKPSTGDGSGLLSAVKWLVTLGALGAVGYYGYNYYKAHTHEIHQQLEQLDQVGQPPAPSAAARLCPQACHANGSNMISPMSRRSALAAATGCTGWARP